VSQSSSSLQVLLPPNLEAAAARNTIAVRVELDLAKEPEPQLIPALALLQRWCSSSPKPPLLLALSRSQVRELVAALRGQPCFAFVNRSDSPIAWDGGNLIGISEHLEEPAATKIPEPGANARPKRSACSAASDSGTSRHEPALVDGSEHFVSITLPAREHPSYAEIRDLVKMLGFVLEPSNRRWWLRDRHKALNFIAAYANRLREVHGARFTPNFEKNTARLQQVEAVASVAPESGSEAFSVTLGLASEGVPEAALRAALNAGSSYVEHEGRVVLLDPSRVSRLALAQARLAGSPASGAPEPRRTFRIPAARVASANEVIEEIAPGYQPPEAWRRRSDPLRHLSALAPAPIDPGLEAQLRPYQSLGVAWLWYLWEQQLGGVLADEMGLGKTLQALGLLTAVAGKGVTVSDARAGTSSVGGVPSRRISDPRVGAPGATLQGATSLVVAPASLLENWRREAARFTPHLRVFVHHGSNRVEDTAAFARFDLIVTSYGTLARDRALFEKARFACLVADEAQHIKNRRSQNASALRAIAADARFLLTGTPLENSLDDLRSLFDVLLPGYLGRPPEGVRGEERAWHDRRLRELTAPYILRRTKQSVAPELPEKIEQVVWCEFAEGQQALYREIQQQSERELIDLAAGGAGESSLRFAALTQLLRLRQVCCDPRLLPDTARPGGATAVESAKLDALMELLAESIDDGHRVLVFSQFTSLLALVRELLDAEGIAHVSLDGSMSRTARQAAVDRFQSDTSIPVFLLSLKAGGTGLNLTAADTVVHLDPWWNPAAEAQATDRAHRIGQTRVVTTYKLIVSGTVEEKVLALQDTKKALLADVFEASDAAAAKLSLADLKSLIAPR
jgi:superfamily II DNA or RNA helicase